MEKVHLRQDVSLGNEAAITSPEHFDCVLFSIFRVMWNDRYSGTTQGKLSLKLSTLPLLDSFVFSYYKYAFLNLFLSLLMLLLAHWDTFWDIKRLAKFLFSAAQMHLCLSLPHADPFLAHLTHTGQTLFLMLLSLCIVNQLTLASAPFTALGGQAVWQGSTQSSVSSGEETFALQIISPGMTQPQDRHVFKWRGDYHEISTLPRLETAGSHSRCQRIKDSGDAKCPGCLRSKIRYFRNRGEWKAHPSGWFSFSPELGCRMGYKAGGFASVHCFSCGSTGQGWGCPLGRKPGLELWGKAWTQHLCHS